MRAHFSTDRASACHCNLVNHRTVWIAAVVSLCNACNGGDSTPPNGTSAGGTTGLGGALATGGTTAQGGAIGSGGATSPATGGASATGGNRATGGVPATGGLASSGGIEVAAGGNKPTGGSPSTGGAVSAGGNQAGGSQAGGKSATGGTTSTGGAATTGGVASIGGSSTTGGARNTGGVVGTGGNPASGGTNSAGGSTAYSPCAASPCKVLPFGDSITHGLQSSDNGGYRSQLFKLVVAANQTLTFVGSQSSGPGTVSSVTFPKNHEGHDGFTVDSGYSTYGTAGISSLIPSPAFSTLPDIVLLHIGTNDITSTGSASATTATRLDGLLGKIVTAAPKALIVVAQITPVSWTSGDLNTYNSKIPGLVQARAAQGQHIISVDMSQMPKSGLATDGVHPNDQGYSYMAGVWYAAIKGYLR